MKDEAVVRNLLEKVVKLMEKSLKPPPKDKAVYAEWYMAAGARIVLEAVLEEVELGEQKT